MARKKFEEGFKENAIEYCKTHSDMTIKACAAELGIGYSTLRRWISQSEEQAETVNIETNQVETAEVSEEPVEQALTVAPEETSKQDEVLLEKDVPVAETMSDKTVENEATIEDVVSMAAEPEEAFDETSACSVLDLQVEAVQEDLDDEFDWINKREQVKSQLGGFIETAGSGVSDAVQLIGLYKKRHELKKVQKKLQKEKEKRMKQ